MRAINVTKNSPLFVPNYFADSVMAIDFKMLKKDGVDFVAFDADSTLVSFRKKTLDVETEQYLNKELKRFAGVCIASNRVTNDLNLIAEALNAEVIRATFKTRKPSVRFFDRVVTLFSARPEKIAMIGDKLIADIYGANKAGLKTVWVNKKGRDSIIDWVLQTRRFERRMTRHHVRRN